MAESLAGHRRAPRNTEFREKVLDVGLDGSNRDRELITDLPVGQSVDDQPRHAPLTLRKAFPASAPAPFRSGHMPVRRGPTEEDVHSCNVAVRPELSVAPARFLEKPHTVAFPA
ncbi:MAG: hypothetical protein M3295_03315 [Chloroflexota bacterium]|nr:hypothetical protein [Chloroflexota bacterium]